MIGVVEQDCQRTVNLFGQQNPHKTVRPSEIAESQLHIGPRGHRLAVATGKNRRGLDDALAQAELHGVFDATRTADETAGKPHPLMLQQLMAELGVAPERTLMIGDTTHDLQMARNAGTPSVAVSFGAHEPEAFAKFGPLAVVHSTDELQRWLADNA